MKTNLPTLALSLGFAAFAASGWAQDAAPSPTADAAPTAAAASSTAAPRADLRFNFRGAPLETVLNYMSQAAGYVIVLQTPVTGTVDMWSDNPVSKEEAVQLLNIALNKNGYTATIQGQNLIVSSKDDANWQQPG
jgi:general secretion pathway protein D